MKINVKEWKAFRVGDLFNIHPTRSYKHTNHQLFNGASNPVIVNSAYNNGIGGYTSLENTEQGNIITFSDTVDANTIFYQENDFVGYSHVQGLYPKEPYKKLWNKECLLFFISVFKKSAFVKGFNYGNKFRRDIAVNLEVILPCKNGEPDFEYMETYMSHIYQKVNKSLQIFKPLINMSNLPIDITSWKEFKISELFEIKRP